MRVKTLMTFCGALAVSAWSWGLPSAPVSGAAAQGGEVATEQGTLQPQAEVRVGDNVVFAIRAARAGRSPAARAHDANEALQEAIAANALDVRVEYTDSAAVVYAGSRPIVQLGQEDAVLAGDASIAVHADRVAGKLRAALASEHTRSVVAGTIFNATLAVVFAVLAVLLLRGAWRYGDRAAKWLEANPGRVPDLHVRTLKLLSRGTVRAALSLGNVAGRWIVMAGIAYAWLMATFSLFESTRGFTVQLSGALLDPLATLLSRVGAAIPLAAVMALALLALLLALRALRLFFGEVASGDATVSWLPRDLARPAGILAEAGLVVVALLLAGPVISGSSDGAVSRTGLVAIGALALALVPLGAGVAMGVATLFARWIAVGDWFEVGSHRGKVTRIGVLEVILRDETGAEVRVPHLARLWHPTRACAHPGRIVELLPVERTLATPTLASKVSQALGRIGADASVRLVGVTETQATLELSVSSEDSDARSACLWAALAEVEAARREASRP